MRSFQPFGRALGALLALAVVSAELSPTVLAQAAPSPAPAAAAAPAAAKPIVWPLVLNAVAGGTIVLYEPQVRSWPHLTKLSGIAAVAVTLPGATAPVYGTLTFTSLASADVPTGMLSLENSDIDAFSWPTAAAADVPALTAFVKTNLHVTGKPVLPLALALASIPKQDRPQTMPAPANPPVIYVSKTPAVLVAFAGKPVFEPIAGSTLQYAANANSEVVHDPSATTYYVRIKSGWFSSAAITGPFVQAAAPAGAATIPAVGPWVHPLAGGSATATAPRFIVSLVPAALIDIDGEVQFANIPGTQLRYVNNTPSDVFFSRTTTVWYVLISGRWFSAANLNGPWHFASNHLPKDFMEIPEANPRGRVLASVPGTTQAFYAASVEQAPHVSEVDLSTAKLTVNYAGGTPKFEVLAGTPLQYAANADADVIQINPAQYVACSDGIWFAAPSPAGPWIAATYVPAVVYTIPANSPLYRVTFVHVYDARGIAQTAPKPGPTPNPKDTYVNFSAGNYSTGDRVAYYNANTYGYYGVYGAGSTWSGYAFNAPHYGNYNDTTFARQQNAPSTTYKMDTTNTAAVPMHGPRVVPGPNTNVYAAADGVYRYVADHWQKNTGGETWVAEAEVPATLGKDRHARLDGYRGTTTPV